MGLLDFVEQHHRVRPAADRFGKLAAFLVADVARRRSDQAAGGELLHVLRHVDLDERLGVAEHELGEVAGEVSLAHPGRPEEQERTDRPARVLEVGAGTAEGLGDRLDGFVLADDAAFELAFHLEQLLGFLLLHPAERDTRPLGNDRHDVLVTDFDDGLLGLGAPVLEGLVEGLLDVLLLVAERGCLLEVLLADRADLLAVHLFDVRFELLDFRRPGHRADAGAGTGLVEHVDRLVGQITAGEVARSELDRGLDGFRREARLVVRLILFLQALHDLDRVLDRGLFDLDLLEAALESGVLFDVLAVLVQRRRADHLELRTGKRGLDDVGGIHRALGRAGTDDGVELVDEQDDVLHLADLVHHRLDAFLELAAVFGTGDHQREVEGDDLLVAEDFRHVARGNFLGEAFDDGGLADARFPDQHRVVLRAAAEDLDHAFDLRLAADDRVEAVLAGKLGQVAAESTQRRGLGLAFGFRLLVFVAFVLEAFLIVIRVFVVIVVRREIRIDLGEDLVAGALDIDIHAAQHAGGHAFAFAEQAEQDVFGADVAVVERFRLLVGKGEHLLDPRRVGDATGNLLAGAGADFLLHFHADALEVEPHAFEHVDRDALAQLDQAEQQVLGAHVAVVETVRLLPGKCQDLLGSGCEVVHRMSGF